MKKNITDRTLKALESKGRYLNEKWSGEPYEMMDTKVPGFGVRIMGKPGAPLRSFILVKRFPGSNHPTRRT